MALPPVTRVTMDLAREFGPVVLIITAALTLLYVGRALWEALTTAGERFGARPCGLGARDTLRLEAGMPLYGNELDRTTNPYEAGLGFSVAKDKTGWTATERLEAMAKPSVPLFFAWARAWIARRLAAGEVPTDRPPGADQAEQQVKGTGEVSKPHFEAGFLRRLGLGGDCQCHGLG